MSASRPGHERARHIEVLARASAVFTQVTMVSCVTRAGISGVAAPFSVEDPGCAVDGGASVYRIKPQSPD